MIKSILRISAVSLLATAVAGLPRQVPAQSTNQPAAIQKAGGDKKDTTEKKTSAEKKDTKQKTQRNLPYKGDLGAVDKTAKTITVSKRTFQIASETKLFRDGKPAILEDGVVGEYLTLSYQRLEDGKFVAHNVYFGGKQKEKAREQKKDTAPPKDTAVPKDTAPK
jgi:hypothetical protein